MSGRGMLWQPATVIAIETEGVTVSFDPLSQCQRCLSGQGCGAGVFSRLFPSRATRLRLTSSQRFEPGQRVRVGLSSRQLMRAALTLYGVPLSGFLAGTLLGHLVFRSMAYPDLGALLSGLVVAAVFLACHRPWRIRVLNPAVEPLSCSLSGPDKGELAGA